MLVAGTKAIRRQGATFLAATFGPVHRTIAVGYGVQPAVRWASRPAVLSDGGSSIKIEAILAAVTKRAVRGLGNR